MLAHVGGLSAKHGAEDGDMALTRRAAMALGALAVFGALAALTVFGARLAHADSYWELEHARANARAGGPVSERDAELLERYGCLSGTQSEFCEKLRQRDDVHKVRPRRQRDKD